MKWEKLFAKRILERGYEYYYDNAVDIVEQTYELIKANVMGSDEYEVEITLCDEEVIGMSCTCPYAADGNNCKHMAAVLYQWSEGEFVDDYDFEDDDYYNNDNDSIEELVNSASEKDIRSFLINALNEDEALLTRFRYTISNQVTQEDINYYIRKIDNIEYTYTDKYHFIDYYHASKFVSDLETILYKDVCQMIDSGNILSAFTIMNHIFVLIGTVEMDDSSGSGGMIADRINDLWFDLLMKANPEEKQKMFHWFISHLDGSIIDYMEEKIENIIFAEFNEKEYQQIKLDLVKERIGKLKNQDDTSSFFAQYDIGKWAIRYLDILKESNASDEQLKEICYQNWDNSYVRKYYIDICMKNKEYDHALKILDECIILDYQHNDSTGEYSKMKKEIYLLQGNKSAYMVELWKLLIEYNSANLDLFNELKSQYTTNEWIKKREIIFQKLKNNRYIDKYYAEEKLYDRLLTYTLNTPGLDKIQEYEKILVKEYPKQVLTKYIDELNKMAVQASKRKDYTYLVSLLRRMKKIDGGIEVVEKIVNEWLINYKKRPAMMDELRKL